MATPGTIIAFVTDDGSTISSHFGRALYYELITLENGKIADRKHVSKAGHHSFGSEAHGDHGHQNDHKHAVMTVPLAGVTVLVSRGMGMGARQHLVASGITPILTDLHTIDEAVEHYVAGTLVHNPRRLHDHGPQHG